MNGRIARLEPEVVNRIAAGEVVERPASALKELVENSLDADARAVTVEFESAGLALLRVSDDGTGMTREDVRLSIERHATSKIVRAEDLATVGTFGFRGEALAAIASVAELTITTRARGTDLGTRLRRGPSGWTVEAWGGPPGATVEVRDLFARLPARRKFLKSPPTETRHLVGAFLRLALSAHDRRLELRGDGGLSLLFLPRPRLRRMAEVLGGETARDLVEVQGEDGGVSVEGLLSPPSRGAGSRQSQYFLVNGRVVGHRSLSFLLADLYRASLPAGRHPVAALSIRLDPRGVDVNVHPAKAEVRFADERIVVAAVRGILSASLRHVRAVSPIRPPGPEGSVASPEGQAPDSAPLWSAEGSPAFGPEGGTARETPAPPRDARAGPALAELRFLGQAHRLFLLAEGPDGVYLVDQHAAHERIVYEQLQKSRAGGGGTQRLLFPVVVQLAAADAATLPGHAEFLARIGFEFSALSGGAVSVSGIPADLGAVEGRSAFQEIVQALAERDVSPTEAEDRMLRRLACHAVTVAGEKMSAEETASLLARLAACEEPYTCPHGRPSLLLLPLQDLLRHFRRR